MIVDIYHRWQVADDVAGVGSTVRRSQDDSQTRCAEHAIPDRPIMEDYIAAFPLLGTVESLPSELVAEEYMARCRAGKKPDLDEYRRRFPQSHETPATA